MMKAWMDFFSNRCPKCRKSAVFTGLYRMHKKCPACDLKFEREQGYYLGSMIVAYALSAMSVIPTIVYLHFKSEVDFPMIVIVPCVQVALLNPLLFMYSRLAWLYIDHNINPKAWQ